MNRGSADKVDADAEDVAGGRGDGRTAARTDSAAAVHGRRSLRCCCCRRSAVGLAAALVDVGLEKSLRW